MGAKVLTQLWLLKHTKFLFGKCERMANSIDYDYDMNIGQDTNWRKPICVQKLLQNLVAITVAKWAIWWLILDSTILEKNLLGPKVVTQFPLLKHHKISIWKV